MTSSPTCASSFWAGGAGPLPSPDIFLPLGFLPGLGPCGVWGLQPQGSGLSVSTSEGDIEAQPGPGLESRSWGPKRTSFSAGMSIPMAPPPLFWLHQGLRKCI